MSCSLRGGKNSSFSRLREASPSSAERADGRIRWSQIGRDEACDTEEDQKGREGKSREVIEKIRVSEWERWNLVGCEYEFGLV